jgi:hypothetical protein
VEDVIGKRKLKRPIWARGKLSRIPSQMWLLSDKRSASDVADPILERDQ